MSSYRTTLLLILTSFFWLLTSEIHADTFGEMLHRDTYTEAEDRKARQEFLALAKQGNAEAQTSLGTYYKHGWGGPKDLAQARDWYRKAAEQGHALAQFELGLVYDEGTGVLQDYREARDWYRKAAEQGHALAQASLGDMYKEGRDQKQDYAQAHMWYNLAAAHESGYGRELRDRIAKEMTHEQIAVAQRLAREWLAQHQK